MTPAKTGYNALLAQQQQIAAEFGDPLDWQEMPTRKGSHVASFLRVEDTYDQEGWPRLHAWMLERLIRFDRVFTGRVKALPAQAEAYEDALAS
ncbi:MAG: DUF4268 domain-containing protein [Asticcacaulis sp.]